jgi:hypothetical protein
MGRYNRRALDSVSKGTAQEGFSQKYQADPEDSGSQRNTMQSSSTLTDQGYWEGLHRYQREESGKKKWRVSAGVTKQINGGVKLREKNEDVYPANVEATKVMDMRLPRGIGVSRNQH